MSWANERCRRMRAFAAKFSIAEIRSLSSCQALAAVLLIAASSPTLPAQSQPAPKPAPEIALTLDPAQSTVHFTVGSTLHAVHGTFAFKSGAIHFDPDAGKAGGEFVVDTASGESGDDSRDMRMKKEILEAPKFPEIIFHPTQVEGKVDPSGASDVKLHGIFSIHGADHEITATVHAQLTGDRWTATANFDVPYIAWGIKNPSNFFLKVKPVVNVDLEMSGHESHEAFALHLQAIEARPTGSGCSGPPSDTKVLWSQARRVAHAVAR